MESLSDNRQSVQYPEQPGITAAVCVDLWTYGGSPGKLRELPWRSEGAVADLFAKVVAEHEGKIIEGSQNKLLIYFDNPMRALSAAKSLQLTLRARAWGCQSRSAACSTPCARSQPPSRCN